MTVSLAPPKALDIGEFRTWSQQDWQEFVLSRRAQECDRNLIEGDFFQKFLLEVGVFGGSEFFNNIPTTFLRIASDEEQSIRHTARRVVFHSGQTDLLKEFVRFQFEGDPIVLIRQPVMPGYSFWEIVRPSVENDRRLISNPAVYAKITEIANIDKTANAALLSFLPQPVARLTLEYAAFPQKSRERFDKMGELLFKHFRSIDDRLLGRDKERREAVVGKIENIENLIGGYVDAEDRVEDTDSAQ